MKRTALAIIALLALGPCATADTFRVTSGLIEQIGTAVDTISLVGSGFTASGDINIGPGVCRDALSVPEGFPIMGCAGNNWIGGSVDITQGTVSKNVGFGFDWMVWVTQEVIVPTGTGTQTITEPATFSSLTGCVNELFFPDCSPTTLVLPSEVLFSVTFTNDASGYQVLSESYTFTIPEPGTILLLGVGLLGLVFVGRKHFSPAQANS
jgi:hypothetical protein